MKLVQKITSLFLAVVFVLSSLGFTINKMVCLKSGKTKVSLTHVKDCCPEKKSTIPVVKSQCCDIQNSSFKLTDFNPSQKHDVPASFELVSFLTSSITVPDYTNNKLAVFLFADLPPPIYGRTLLTFISTLNI
jgi:hypothetical protein